MLRRDYRKVVSSFGIGEYKVPLKIPLTKLILLIQQSRGPKRHLKLDAFFATSNRFSWSQYD